MLILLIIQASNHLQVWGICFVSWGGLERGVGEDYWCTKFLTPNRLWHLHSFRSINTIKISSRKDPIPYWCLRWPSGCGAALWAVDSAVVPAPCPGQCEQGEAVSCALDCSTGVMWMQILVPRWQHPKLKPQSWCLEIPELIQLAFPLPWN